MVDDNGLRADRLKLLREAHGWSQRELARLCGLGEAQIGKYESGQTEPTASSLKVISDKLNVSVDYLLGTSDEPRRIDAGNLGEDEYQVLDTFRREGWAGIARLGVERLSK